MRCTHCGAIIPDDQVVCPECGAEVQIVPDYNPLDDVLAREVKGSVEGATRQIQTDDIRRYRRDDRTKNVNSTRILSPEERSRIRDRKRAGGQRMSGKGTVRGTAEMRGQRRNTSELRAQKKNTSEMRDQRRNTDELRRSRQNTDEQRRARQQKRLEAAKRKRRNLLITLFLLLALIIAGVYLVYQNSYTSMINKGYRAIQSGDYDQAESYFDRAVRKDRSKPDAYTGYADVY